MENVIQVSHKFVNMLEYKHIPLMKNDILLPWNIKGKVECSKTLVLCIQGSKAYILGAPLVYKTRKEIQDS